MQLIKRIVYSCAILLCVQCDKPTGPIMPANYGTVKFTFKNTVKGLPLVLNANYYTNALGESYKVSRFKYYISNVVLTNIDKRFAEQESYHLIDEANAASQSFSFNANVEMYSHITFTIGVDSIRNVSGAQTGALDPLNDMFWTWTTGYIMAKLEGSSPISTQVNNKIEYHIGGFSGVNNVVKKISLTIPASLPLLNIQQNKTSEVIIEADVDKWFSNNLSFATEPICTTPGVLAKKIADNYQSMFTIKQVINN